MRALSQRTRLVVDVPYAGRVDWKQCLTPLFLASLVGCFAESPPVNEDATGDGGSSESTAGVASTGTDTTGSASGESTETAVDETVGPGCVEDSPQIGLVDADLVIAIDPALADPDPITAQIGEALALLAKDESPTNVAVIAQASSQFPCPAGECDGEMQGCAAVETSATPPANPLDLFLPPGPYECILRPPSPDDIEPRVHVILVTNRPEAVTEIPPLLGPILEQRDASFHVACPDCSPEDAAGMLAGLVDNTGGWIADLNEPDAARDLVILAGVPRVYCAWIAEVPEGYSIDDLTVRIETNIAGTLELERVSDSIACSEGPEPTPEYFVVEESETTFIGLCLPTCALAQFEFVEDVTVTHEFCG